MNNNLNNERYSNVNTSRTDDDQLRPETANEVIRDVQGGLDGDISNLATDATNRSGTHDSDGTLYGSNPTQGVSLSPNDASAVRSGGFTDMDDQTAGGAGLATDRLGSGANISTKRNVTGSDFDGQNTTA